MAKTVLITGGARRIGRAIAERLAQDGWRVLIHARRPDDEDARMLAQKLGGAAFHADLSEPLAPARLFNAVCAYAPECCALVNNASLFSAEETPDPETAARMEAVNVTACEKLLMMLALRLMTNDENGVGLPRKGAAVNLLDTRILRGEPLTPYGRTKKRLCEIQQRLACQFGDVLRINAVAPGPVLAPLSGHEKGGETVLPERPTPHDVAAAVSYLLTAQSVTGAVIPVDAGQHLL
jgi:NAD(P)-dependent dehydrogenase (short-subunit alcohol dehydrogenase family)